MGPQNQQPLLSWGISQRAKRKLAILDGRAALRCRGPWKGPGKLRRDEVSLGPILKGLVCHPVFRLYPVGQREKFGGEEGRRGRSLRERQSRKVLFMY